MAPTKQVKLRDVSQVDYATASQWFYRQGNLTDTLRALESLQARGMKFDKPKRDFQTFVAGMARLKGGWPLPPRQPNAGLMSRRQHVLYCLHQSVPHATNGYSTRSHGVAVGLQQAGFKVRATTRPGFPGMPAPRASTRAITKPRWKALPTPPVRAGISTRPRWTITWPKPPTTTCAKPRPAGRRSSPPPPTTSPRCRR
ncbi:hypothetical protein [Halomonas sp. E19]|uniref:hypothetical protein n=1 Tax=Halomonas sp. E19 TaxID=3397247 RepID=UPI004034B519